MHRQYVSIIGGVVREPLLCREFRRASRRTNDYLSGRVLWSLTAAVVFTAVGAFLSPDLAQWWARVLWAVTSCLLDHFFSELGSSSVTCMRTAGADFRTMSGLQDMVILRQMFLIWSLFAR